MVELQGTLVLLILKTLAGGPNHGFGIALHIQTVSEGLLRVEEGSLYPALHRLERDKIVKARWTQTENGRRARVSTSSPGPAANGWNRPNGTGTTSLKA